ncbi:hypothetical protein [Elioraea sp.]|uniref:hypothetical protein n=1 Tax=Elioraea sp. TaxID=2185103 RepID=UPI003F6FDD6A
MANAAVARAWLAEKLGEARIGAHLAALSTNLRGGVRAGGAPAGSGAPGCRLHRDARRARGARRAAIGSVPAHRRAIPDLAGHAVEVASERGTSALAGVISPPSLTRATATEQHPLVNGRPVADRLIPSTDHARPVTPVSPRHQRDPRSPRVRVVASGWRMRGWWAGGAEGAGGGGRAGCAGRRPAGAAE